MKAARMDSLAAEIKTQEGVFRAFYSGKGLAALEFPGTQARPVPAGGSPKSEWLDQTRRALLAILEGKAPAELPPLDLSGHTPFRRRVWAQLRRVPPGKTVSYGELAKAIGKIGAARAVGNACGANPIPVLIPCHRVLATNGRLGGFSGGLEWKRRLLAREGIRPA